MHLSAEDLGPLVAPGLRGPLGHLLQCPRCRRNLGALFEPDSPAQEAAASPFADLEAQLLGTPPLPRLFTRALDLLSLPDRLPVAYQAPSVRLLEELLGFPPGQRQEVLEAQPRFRVAALADVLLRAADQQTGTNPSLAREIGLLAVAVLEKMELTSRIRRRLALAYCILAEAERARGHLDVADDLLASGVRELSNAPFLLEVRARLCRTLGSLRQEQLRVDEALALFERARTIAQELAADAEQAQAALALGWLLLEENEAENAIPLLWEAYHLSDDERAPCQVLSALHALALAFADCGWEASLAEILSLLDSLAARLPPGPDEIRVARIRAQIDWRLDRQAAALHGLETVFRRLLREGSLIDAATAALELAQRHLESDSPREALAEIAGALAAASGRLAPHLAEVADFALRVPGHRAQGFFIDTLESASAYIQRARFDPALPFFPLPDPDLTLDWRNLDPGQQQKAAEAAGITLGRFGNPSSRRDLRRLAWTYEALQGIRLELPDSDAALLDETSPA